MDKEATPSRWLLPPAPLPQREPKLGILRLHKTDFQRFKFIIEQLRNCRRLVHLFELLPNIQQNWTMLGTHT